MKYALVLAADWANGLFAVLAAGWITGTEVLWWHFLVGIALSHLPDVDALPELWQRGKVGASSEHGSDHRTFLHFPLLSLPLSLLAVWLWGYWGFVLFFAVILHLVNDLYGTGWGLPLCWPLTDRHYKLLGRRVNRRAALLMADGDWDSISNEERRLRLVVSWSGEELPTYYRRWGDENWIDRWYGSVNWISGTEWTLFGLAVILTLLTLLQ